MSEDPGFPLIPHASCFPGLCFPKHGTCPGRCLRDSRWGAPGEWENTEPCHKVTRPFLSTFLMTATRASAWGSFPVTSCTPPLSRVGSQKSLEHKTVLLFFFFFYFYSSFYLILFKVAISFLFKGIHLDRIDPKTTKTTQPHVWTRRHRPGSGSGPDSTLPFTVQTAERPWKGRG